MHLPQKAILLVVFHLGSNEVSAPSSSTTLDRHSITYLLLVERKVLLRGARHLLRFQNVARIAVTPEVLRQLCAPMLLRLREDGRQSSSSNGLGLLQVLRIECAMCPYELVPDPNWEESNVSVHRVR